MGKNKDTEAQELDTMTLELDDGTTLECIVLTVLDVNEKQYIALLPQDENGEVSEDAPVYLYGYEEHENGDVDLWSIDDDEEFEAVSDAYDEFLDNAEFEDVFGDF